MGLARPFHGVIAGIYVDVGCDRTEFADHRVDDISVVHDVGIIAKLRLGERGSLPDFGVASELRVPDNRIWMDKRALGKLLWDRQVSSLRQPPQHQGLLA